jgi:hypothetical protein
MSVPTFDSSLGREAVELAASAGLVLDAPQQLVLEHGMAVREDGKWATFEVALNEPRQNGKGAILEARELAGLFLVGSRFQIHSAHQVDTSLEAFRRLLGLIEDTPDLDRQVKRVRRTNGQEEIELLNGCRIRFRSRSRGGGRGFSCDDLYLDEAMFLPEFAHGALMPTLSARPNPQVWYMGSAVDQLIHENGVVWARVRERGHAGDDPSLAYFEWSVDAESPLDVTDQMAEDHELWAVANPALGIRIGVEHVENELRSMDPRTFAVERLGVGDWPATDGLYSGVIGMDAWRELEDETSVLVDPVCLAFDVSPDRRCSIAAAGRNQEGLWHLEIVACRAGTAWLPEKLADLVAKHQPAVVCCDGYSSESVVPVVDEAGVKVTSMKIGEHAQACGRLVDAVSEKTLRHLGHDALTAAVRGAQTRPIGDAWLWSRRNSSVDISPLVAATLALSAAMDEQEGEVRIF